MADAEHRLLVRSDVWRAAPQYEAVRRVAYLRRCDLPYTRQFVSATVSAGESSGTRFGPLDDLLLWNTDPAVAPGAAEYAMRLFAPLPRQTVFAVVVGTGPSAGRWDAAGTHNGVTLPVERVRLAGSRMLTLSRQPPPADPIPDAWSRVAGAVGESAFRRLRDLTVAVVGLGRTGTLAADQFARHGVRSLILIDGDVDEVHSRDTVFEPAVVGRHKVLNRADGLVARHLGELTVRAIPRGARLPVATAALRRADVAVSCLDDNAARLHLARQCSEWGLLHLDIGTGVLPGARRGADIRLCVCGESCLSCHGGLTDEAAARRALARPVGMLTSERPPDWRDRRAGSLPALNAVAVGLGVQAVVDLVAGTRTGGGWMHMDWPPGGVPVVTERPPTPLLDHCPTCGRI